jgi:hypothetical protein
MSNEERIIELLEENNRLLSIFVGPIVSLKSEQLAKASREDRKVFSKQVLKDAREKMRREGKK